MDDLLNEVQRRLDTGHALTHNATEARVEDIRALMAEVRRLRAEIEEMRDNAIQDAIERDLRD